MILMELVIKNIGKIKTATIKLDGITVVCGDNNTGKSTVGKVLFSYFNALCNFQEKISLQKSRELDMYLQNNLLPRDGLRIYLEAVPELLQLMNTKEGNLSIAEISAFLLEYPPVKSKKQIAEGIHAILSMKNEDLLNEYIFRYFMDIFNGQLKTENQNGRGSVETIFRNGKNKIRFFKKERNYHRKCRLFIVPIILIILLY